MPNLSDTSGSPHTWEFHSNEIPEWSKSASDLIVEIVEYAPHFVVSRTIIKKFKGNITVTSLDAGEALSEKRFPFDTFIQIVDGVAELSIYRKDYLLRAGQGMIIPAHANYRFNANVRFKMIATVIENNYEDKIK